MPAITGRRASPSSEGCSEVSSWNLENKKNTHEYKKERNRFRDMENKLMVTRGERKGEEGRIRVGD